MKGKNTPVRRGCMSVMLLTALLLSNKCFDNEGVNLSSAVPFTQEVVPMPRVDKDDLEYCRKNHQCWDCYVEFKATEAIAPLQRRRKRDVPCCRRHFNQYRSRISELNGCKYGRRSETKQKLGLCVCSPCCNKLIPPEIIPRWLRGERT